MIALIWACVSLYPCFFGGRNFEGAVLHSQEKCLTSLHLKQAPLLISLVLLLTVIVSMSMVFRSGLGLKLNFLVPFLFFWVGDFPAGVNLVMVQFQTCHLWWIFLVHLYQSARFSGTLDSIIIFCCNPPGRVSLKQLMTAVESVIPVFVKSDLKRATCLSMFPVCPLNLISFISVMTLRNCMQIPTVNNWVISNDELLYRLNLEEFEFREFLEKSCRFLRAFYCLQDSNYSFIYK